MDPGVSSNYSRGCRVRPMGYRRSTTASVTLPRDSEAADFQVYTRLAANSTNATSTRSVQIRVNGSIDLTSFRSRPARRVRAGRPSVGLLAGSDQWRP